MQLGEILNVAQEGPGLHGARPSHLASFSHPDDPSALSLASCLVTEICNINIILNIEYRLDSETTRRYWNRQRE